MPKQKWVELFQFAHALAMENGRECRLSEDLKGCRFPDARLDQRFQKFVGQLANRLGQSIPLARQGWANTKAAYRFLSNPRVTEGPILAGHFQATRARVAAIDGTILILHDTTAFTYYRDSIKGLGATYKSFISYGREQYAVRGILMHSSLAVTTEGLPLGLTAIKFWNRDKFKGTEYSLDWKSRGSKSVDWKSTVVNDLLALLFVDVLTDHLIRDRS